MPGRADGAPCRCEIMERSSRLLCRSQPVPQVAPVTRCGVEGRISLMGVSLPLRRRCWRCARRNRSSTPHDCRRRPHSGMAELRPGDEPATARHAAALGAAVRRSKRRENRVHQSKRNREGLIRVKSKLSGSKRSAAPSLTVNLTGAYCGPPWRREARHGPCRNGLFIQHPETSSTAMTQTAAMGFNIRPWNRKTGTYRTPGHAEPRPVSTPEGSNNHAPTRAVCRTAVQQPPRKTRPVPLPVLSGWMPGWIHNSSRIPVVTPFLALPAISYRRIHCGETAHRRGIGKKQAMPGRVIAPRGLIS